MNTSRSWTGRTRFLAACRGEETDRPPAWMMRQAGRSLPEYRKRKGDRPFHELVRDPEAAAEITLQPVRRFGWDAAVIFSDIFVVAEALGIAYRLEEGRGVRVDFDLERDLDRLRPGEAPPRFDFTPRAVRLVREAVGNRTAVLGFAAAPWTLAAFLLEGGSARDPRRARAAAHAADPRLERLLALLTETTAAFLRAQVAAGADAVQLFDTLGGLLPSALFPRWSGRWIRRIAETLPPGVPLIYFRRGAPLSPAEAAELGAKVLSVDWTVDLRAYADALGPAFAVQGNLDPALLAAEPAVAARAARDLLAAMRGRGGYIFNLGHGVPPDARLDTLHAVAETVTGPAAAERGAVP